MTEENDPRQFRLPFLPPRDYAEPFDDDGEEDDSDRGPPLSRSARLVAFISGLVITGIAWWSFARVTRYVLLGR